MVCGVTGAGAGTIGGVLDRFVLLPGLLLLLILVLVLPVLFPGPVC